MRAQARGEKHGPSEALALHHARASKARQGFVTGDKAGSAPQLQNLPAPPQQPQLVQEEIPRASPVAKPGEVPRRRPMPPLPEPQAHMRCESLPPFEPAIKLQHFQEFIDSNWDHLGASPTLRSVNEYLAYLYPYVACIGGAPPAVVSRPKPVKYSCDKPFWDGPRPKPRKIVSFVPFGYELDILEVRLHEHEDVVDLTVLSESLYTHRITRKPLFFERNKERFARFADAILHVIDDDTHFFKHRSGEHRKGEDWRNEGRMRQYPWAKFLEAMGLHKHDSKGLEDYLIVTSDMDELPSAEQLAHFKYCKPKSAGPHYRLGAVMYSHNFRWYRPQPTPGTWEYSTTISEGSSLANAESLPRSTNGQKYDEHLGWIMNRMFSSYTDMFKELALAEGGNIPQKRPKALAYNPLIADEWRSRGIRTCCLSDVRCPLATLNACRCACSLPQPRIRLLGCPFFAT